MQEFVRGVGGQVISDKLPPSPSFSNADFAFVDRNVFVELKCLQTDFAHYGIWRGKLERLYLDWLKEGSLTFPMLWGREALPRAQRRKIQALYDSPLQNLIRKANRQLRETAEYFGQPNAAKLLLLVNDGLYSAESSITVAQICDILGRGIFSNVHAFVYLTVNRYVALPSDPIARHLWVPAYDNRCPRHLAPFVNWLGEEWGTFIGKKIGGRYERLQTDGLSALTDSRFIPLPPPLGRQIK